MHGSIGEVQEEGRVLRGLPLHHPHSLLIEQVGGVGGVIVDWLPAPPEVEPARSLLLGVVVEGRS